MGTLTNSERAFLSNYVHETLDLEVGPARTWLKEAGFYPELIEPLLILYQREFPLTTKPPKLPFELPWTASELELRLNAFRSP
jgi:hypothetical protein